MSISKEQWKAIEANLKRSWVDMEFSLNGHAIKIQRERKNESTTVLSVYIDGFIKGEWAKSLEKIDADDAFMNGVVKRVWAHSFIKRFNKKALENYAKAKRQCGAKFAHDLYGKDPEKQGVTILLPSFGSSTTLVRQYKKIEGLTLVTELKEVTA